MKDRTEFMDSIKMKNNVVVTGLTTDFREEGILR